jgi:hypothetical protein
MSRIIPGERGKGGKMDKIQVMEKILQLKSDNNVLISKFAEEGKDDRYLRGIDKGLQIAFDLVSKLINPAPTPVISVFNLRSDLQ